MKLKKSTIHTLPSLQETLDAYCKYKSNFGVHGQTNLRSAAKKTGMEAKSRHARQSERTGSARAHRGQMAREGRVAHQGPAPRETVDGVSPEILGRVVVGVLNQTPERPQKIAHRLVDHCPPDLFRAGGRAEIGGQHLDILRIAQPGLDRQVAKIPERSIHAGLFEIHDPHARAIIKEVFAKRIAMAWHQIAGIVGQKLLDR